MRTFVATKNLGKLAEMGQLFAGSALELEPYPAYADVPEDAVDYIGNARLKAQALRAQLLAAGISAAVLADDSGLEVAALNDRPGVFSARYAGAGATWPARRQKLLRELHATGSDDRRARFVCAMVLLTPDAGTFEVVGKVAGRIVPTMRGDSGFGYDPLFVATGETRTFAELSDRAKNAISHRGAAAGALLKALSDRRV